MSKSKRYTKKRRVGIWGFRKTEVYDSEIGVWIAESVMERRERMCDLEANRDLHFPPTDSLGSATHSGGYNSDSYTSSPSTYGGSDSCSSSSSSSSYDSSSSSDSGSCDSGGGD